LTILETSNLTKAFGGVVAVNRVNLEAEPGSILAIIGPNGAGKTTLFNLITGVIPSTEGEVRFKRRVITGLKPHQIASLGIGRTFQNLQLFGNMKVVENVMVGFHTHLRSGFVEALFRLPRCRREERAIVDRAMAILEQVGLADQAARPAGNLPFGQQRLLEIARALAMGPELLLLDEPAAGLNRAETNGLVELIFELKSRGLTILLVEHDMDTVMGVADKVAVLEYGQKIAEGTPAEIQSNERVIAAYLGEEGVV